MIGNTSVTSIGGQVGWSIFSDGRFKKDLKEEEVAGLDFITQLRPVSYLVDAGALDRYLGVPDSIVAKRATARKGAKRQWGFVAQEVKEVVDQNSYTFAGVDVPKNEKDIYRLRYDEFVVPLVKAVQELAERVDQLTTDNLALQAAVADDAGSHGARLAQNNPNPFTSSTNINMFIPEDVSQATIMIYSIAGKQVMQVAVEGRGETAIRVAPGKLTAGIYFYALLVNGQTIAVKRMVLTDE